MRNKTAINNKRSKLMQAWLLGICILAGSFTIGHAQESAPQNVLRYDKVFKYGDIRSGGDSIVFRRINVANEVGGGAQRPNIQKASKAIVLTPDGIENLVGDVSVDFSATFDLNDKGEVAGGLNTATALRPFRAKRGQDFKLLSLLPGDTGGLAFGINEGGEVAGYSSGKLGERAVWWDMKGNIKALQNPSGLTSRALGLNDRGDVVGVSGKGRQQALLWPDKGNLIELGTLPGATASEAVSINNKGDIVGNAIGVEGVPNQARAVMWDPNGQTIQDLGVLAPGWTSRARDINDRNEVVGSGVGGHEARAFIWTAETGMVDINKLVSLPSVLLTDAVGINKKGDIVVIGHEKTPAQLEQDAGHEPTGEHHHGDDGHEQPRQIYVLTRAPGS